MISAWADRADPLGTHKVSTMNYVWRPAIDGYRIRQRFSVNGVSSLVGDDLTIDEDQRVQLADFQKHPIKNDRKRHILLFIEGYRQEVSALVEFDMAVVACRVPSLGCVVAKGYRFSFGQQESYMAKSGVRVKTYPKRRTFVFCVRIRWKDNFACTVVAPEGGESALSDVPADWPGQPA